MSQPTGLHDEKATMDFVPTVKDARIAGALYLLLVVSSLLSFAYLGSLIVSGDATATANNIFGLGDSCPHKYPRRTRRVGSVHLSG
jgi:hypothetical protein